LRLQFMIISQNNYMALLVHGIDMDVNMNMKSRDIQEKLETL